MKYPDNITTPRSKLAYNIFRHIYIFEQGKGAVIGRFTNWVTEALTVYTALTVTGITLHWSVWVIVIFLMFTTCYLLGKLYIHYNIDKINTQVSNERNPFFSDLHKTVKEKDKL